MVEQLKNKPLVEAILEVRWKPLNNLPDSKSPQYYKLLLARLSDSLLSEYPTYEELPTASLPEQVILINNIVQHRFRIDSNKWPLIQLGPGVFTVNSTSDYTWDDFRPRIISAINKLYSAHPKVSDMKMTNIILRYIDAVEFDYLNEDAYEFIKDKLKINISISDNLLNDTNVNKNPCNLTWHSSFKCNQPKGMISIRLATGQKQNKPAIIWETVIESAGDDMPNMPTEFEKWIDSAHEITNNCFFKMIDGDLIKRFKGE